MCPRVNHDVVTVVQVGRAKVSIRTLQIHVLPDKADSAAAHRHRDGRARGVPRVSYWIILPGCVGFKERAVDSAGDVDFAVGIVVNSGREKPLSRHGGTGAPGAGCDIVDLDEVRDREFEEVGNAPEDIDRVCIGGIN